MISQSALKIIFGTDPSSIVPVHVCSEQLQADPARRWAAASQQLYTTFSFIQFISIPQIPDQAPSAGRSNQA